MFYLIILLRTQHWNSSFLTWVRDSGPQRPALSSLFGVDLSLGASRLSTFPRALIFWNHQSRCFIATPQPFISCHHVCPRLHCRQKRLIQPRESHLKLFNLPCEANGHADRLADPSPWLSLVFCSAIWLVHAYRDEAGDYSVPHWGATWGLLSDPRARHNFYPFGIWGYSWSESPAMTKAQGIGSQKPRVPADVVDWNGESPWGHSPGTTVVGLMTIFESTIRPAYGKDLQGLVWGCGAWRGNAGCR